MAEHAPEPGTSPSPAEHSPEGDLTDGSNGALRDAPDAVDGPVDRRGNLDVGLMHAAATPVGAAPWEFRPSWVRRAMKWVLWLALLAGAAWGTLTFAFPHPLGDEGWDHALVGRGRVAYLGPDEPPALSLLGLTLSAAGPELVDAAKGEDPAALAKAMASAEVQAVLVDASVTGFGAESVGGRLAQFEPIDGFRGLYLSPRAALYDVSPHASLTQAHREALTVVARGLLEGKQPPRVSSFPAPLRRVQSVEVMVLLRDGETPRLWRSARGSSVARALLTAAVVARQRWQEKEQTMGGPLSTVLPTLDVEVHLLEEDGTLGDRSRGFLSRVFKPAHGVGFERKGSWRYYLPEKTLKAGRGSAHKAYQALFAEYGFSSDALARPDVRLYRLRDVPLSVQTASDAKLTYTP